MSARTASLSVATRHRAARSFAPALHVVRLAVITALAIDAVVHLTSASSYDPATGGVITEGNLFRAEAATAGVVALLLLVRPRSWSWAGALAVSGSALAAVLLYRYVNVGAIGPIPNLFEPTWQAPGKLVATYAEAVASVLSGFVLAVTRRRSRLRQ